MHNLWTSNIFALIFGSNRQSSVLVQIKCLLKSTDFSCVWSYHQIDPKCLICVQWLHCNLYCFSRQSAKWGQFFWQKSLSVNKFDRVFQFSAINRGWTTWRAIGRKVGHGFSATVATFGYAFWLAWLSIQFSEPAFLCTAFMADGKVTEKHTWSEVGHDESWPENARPTVEKKLYKLRCKHFCFGKW